MSSAEIFTQHADRYKRTKSLLSVKMLDNDEYNRKHAFKEKETKKKKKKIEFVFLQKYRGLLPFWYHIVLYIQGTFILTNEIPREITQKV